ncbi:MAG: C45 family autoproteolytic acyltransferase/hydrolase [Bacteroidales bacterium]|nr:C45 family autoproteolytic acyltransferase/hydrolase [Bacteroidales bacterium]
MKALKITLASIAGIVLAALVAVALVWGGEIRTLGTVKQVEENKYLYQMEYLAPYDLDELVESDIDSNAKLLEYVVKKVGKGIPIQMKSSQVASDDENSQVFNCTSFQAKNAESDGYLYGRNYDFFKNPTMVTVSRPKHGYASIAVSDMSHFGYSLEKLPTSIASKVLCLASIYAPVDGMNEKGVCTSIMALPHMAAQQNSGKHSVGTTVIMRLILDRCATVDEALELVGSVDIRHDATVGSGYHYMVADANGDCAVFEFDKNDGWKTMIIRKEAGKNSMLVTNHLLSEKYFTTEPDPEVGNPHSRSWWRYETAGAYLAEHDGILSLEQAQECLAQVHWKDLIWDNGTVEDTQYSNVYDQKELTLALRNWNEYERTYHFSLR